MRGEEAETQKGVLYSRSQFSRLSGGGWFGNADL